VKFVQILNEKVIFNLSGISWTFFVFKMKGIVVALLFGSLSILLGVYNYGNIGGLSQTTSSSTSKITASSLTMEKVLKGLESISHNSRHHNCSKVAVGYNANLDLIIQATDIMEKLRTGAIELPKDHEKITSLSQFHQTFLYFFEKGSAAERYVTREVFDKILKIAKNLPDHAKDWNIGGNAALMANRFAQEGCDSVLLGGQVGRTLSTLLNSKVYLFFLLLTVIRLNYLLILE
jgi:hypothetical protein